MKYATLALLIASATACGGAEGDDTQDAPDDVDAADAPECTGEAYDHCEDTVDWTDCQDGMECRFFMMSNFTICTPACDVDTPCPDDENGDPVECNMMGRCRGETANTCAIP